MWKKTGFRTLQTCIACLLTIAVRIDKAVCVECMHVRGFLDLKDNTVPCATFHTGCYEQLKVVPDTEELEYSAYCAKGEECKSLRPDECKVCTSDRCNTQLLAEVVKLNYTCYRYEGDLKIIRYADGTLTEMQRFNPRPVHCKEAKCHTLRNRIEVPGSKYTEDDPINAIGGCGDIDCKKWHNRLVCETCQGSLCNEPKKPENLLNRASSDEASKAADRLIVGAAGWRGHVWIAAPVVVLVFAQIF